MDLATLFGQIGSFGEGMDNFAHDNNIRLSIIILLLLLELFWSIAWMMLIKRGITMGLGLWFSGTFVLVLIMCGYVVACVVSKAASSSTVGLLTKIPGVGV